MDEERLIREVTGLVEKMATTHQCKKLYQCEEIIEIDPCNPKVWRLVDQRREVVCLTHLRYCYLCGAKLDD